MEKLTFGQSFHGMTALIRQNGMRFVALLLLILLPAVVIRLYVHQSTYGDYTLRYDLLDQQTLNSALIKGDVTAAAEQFARVFPEETDEYSVTDAVMDVISFLLALALDMGAVMIGLKTLNAFSPDEDERRHWFWSSALQLALVGLLLQWVLANGESLVVPLVLQTAVMGHLSAFYGAAAWMALLLSGSAAVLFVTWLTMFLRFMAAICVSGRTRLFFSFGYAREILRGRMWREILHLLPFTVTNFLLPALLQALAILSSSMPALALTLAGLSVAMEAAGVLLTWMFLLPDVFRMEEQSGIREKINAAMKERNNEHDTRE